MEDIDGYRVIISASRQVLRKFFELEHPGLCDIFEYSGSDEKYLDIADRIFRYVGSERGVDIDYREDMFDFYFTKRGECERPTLVICVPSNVTDYASRIAAACECWIFRNCDEQMVSELLDS